MKEGAAAVAAGASGDGGGSGSGNSAISRSAVEKERTKLRERQRRSIITKIFAGLRKHGGYRLSPRADINQVLRELAKEAGWVVEPDGTTYRSTVVPPPLQSNASGYVCQACGSSGVIRSGTSTPSSSFIAGECSTNTAAADPVMNYSGTTIVYHPNTSSSCGGSGGSIVAHEIPLGNMNNTQLAMYMMYGRLPSGGVHYPPEGGTMSLPPVYQQQQIRMSQVASNKTTPVGSPHQRC